MRSGHIKFLTIILIVLIGGIDLFAQSVTIAVSPARGKREISVGDLFYINIVVKDINANPEKPTDVGGANLVYFDRTGQSSSFSSINGKTTQSTSYTWTATLRAQTEGQYSFGPVTVGGIKSNIVKYAIGAPMPSQQPNPGNTTTPQRNIDPDKPEYIGKGDGNLFMRAEVSQSSAYVNQAILYTVKLYSTYDAIKFIGATASPKFDGFVVEESKDISTSLEYETYNGKTYATAIIARYIIFPQHEGTLSVKGNTYTVSVDQREYYRDPFYGHLSVSKPLQLNVTPNELTVKVKSLPTPVPSDFSGGVGNFHLTSSLPAQKFVTNQVGSIVYTIEGTGNIKYITLPDLQNLYPSELEVYTPTTESNITIGRTNVSGSIKYDYSFMPLEWGNYRLPDIKLVYFNPSTEKYETSVARGYEIAVERGTGSEKSQTQATNTFDSQLLPVNTNLSFIHRPYVYGFFYWLFYIIPIGGIIIAYVSYKSYLASHSDILAVRSRKANRMARKRLKRAYAYMTAKDRNSFYDEIISSLWGYLGDKLRIPISELSRENISGKLAMQDISDKDIDNLIKLIDDVEFEKYAPSASSTEMSDIYERTIATMNSLEEAFKKAKNNEDI
ncbi:MAG: protein BatD [Muribaculaceae bacterium]|nr:protein BatD [Muribaculaceae bacterium]